MTGQRALSGCPCRKFCKRGLKRGQLRFSAARPAGRGCNPHHVAADICIEQNRVADAVAVFAEAANGNVNVDPRALVNDAEQDRRRRAVPVANELLGVEVVDALILGRFAAKGESACRCFKGVEDAGTSWPEKIEGSVEVVDELAGFRAKLRDLALIDDDHALSIGNRHNGAVGDDVLEPL